MFIFINYIFLTNSNKDIDLTAFYIWVTIIAVIWVLLFCLGAYLIIKGVRENKAWKIIIGIFLAGIVSGLIIWGVMTVTNNKKISSKQQIISPPPADSRRKTTPYKKKQKS